MSSDDATLYQIVLHDDTTTPRDFVLWILKSELRASSTDAAVIVHAVEANSRACVGPYSQAVAEPLLERLQAHCRKRGIAFTITLEPYVDGTEQPLFRLAPNPMPRPWWLRWSFVVTFAATLGFMWLLGPGFGLILPAIIALHEFGHLVAMRLTGHPSIKILLIPFLSEVPIPEHPHKSQFADAFCALMGAGLSALACWALLLASKFFEPMTMVNSILVTDARQSLFWPVLLSGTASLIAGLNLMQLFPALPLDGGHVLRHLSANLRVGALTRTLVLTLSVLTLAWMVSEGNYIAAFLLGLGVHQATLLTPLVSSARPMSRTELIALSSGYIATVFIHWICFAPSLSMMTWSFVAQVAPSYAEFSDAEAKSGSSAIEPRFTTLSLDLAKLDQTTLVRGNRRSGGREDLRVFGSPDDDGMFVWLNVIDRSRVLHMARHRNDLRAEAVEVLYREGAEPEFRPGGESFVAAGSFFDSVPFVVDTSEGGKNCRAFHAFSDKGRTYIAGGVCHAKDRPVTTVELQCLASSIAIDGQGAGAFMPQRCLTKDQAAETRLWPESSAPEQLTIALNWATTEAQRACVVTPPYVAKHGCLRISVDRPSLTSALQWSWR